MRFALRKEGWDALKSERDSERKEVGRARTQAGRISFFQRLGIWWGGKEESGGTPQSQGGGD